MTENDGSNRLIKSWSHTDSTFSFSALSVMTSFFSHFSLLTCADLTPVRGSPRNHVQDPLVVPDAEGQDSPDLGCEPWRVVCQPVDPLCHASFVICW